MEIEERNNETNGVFDIEKESAIVANIVIDALIHVGIVRAKDGDRAAEIAAEEILVRRSMEGLRESR